MLVLPLAVDHLILAYIHCILYSVQLCFVCLYVYDIRLYVMQYLAFQVAGLISKCLSTASMLNLGAVSQLIQFIIKWIITEVDGRSRHQLVGHSIEGTVGLLLHYNYNW